MPFSIFRSSQNGPYYICIPPKITLHNASSIFSLISLFQNIIFFFSGKMIHTETSTNSQEKHVFKPEESQANNEDELKRIQKLLDFMKKLEQLNGTVTNDDLKKISKDDLQDFIATINEYNKVPTLNEQNAPNPLSFEYGLDKNEVKRQESSSDSTEAAPEDSSPEATLVDSSTQASKEMSSTTSEDMLLGEEKGPSIEDLEDSFGGKTDPPSTASPPETTTPLRKTGFYYLVDWNSFFDIDDQKGKRVNLRFQPTIGDPKRFLSVTVP